jgi:hypothetical protein
MCAEPVSDCSLQRDLDGLGSLALCSGKLTHQDLRHGGNRGRAIGQLDVDPIDARKFQQEGSGGSAHHVQDPSR